MDTDMIFKKMYLQIDVHVKEGVLPVLPMALLVISFTKEIVIVIPGLATPVHLSVIIISQEWIAGTTRLRPNHTFFVFWLLHNRYIKLYSC